MESRELEPAYREGGWPVYQSMAVLAVNPLVLQGIGLLGMFLSNCLGFSNLPAMLEARRRGILGDINPVVPPFLCGNCFAWCMYATAKQVRGRQPGLPPHR